MMNLDRKLPMRGYRSVNTRSCPFSRFLCGCFCVCFSVWADDVPDPGQILSNQVGDYISAIETAEEDNGAYSTALAELYQGLGWSLVEQEKFAEAKKAFQRGLQIERVNFGLNSPQQAPYLFAIADIEVRSDDWEATEAVLQNIYSINANNYGETNPAMVAGLNDLIRWYVANYRLRSPVNAYMNLIRAESLAQQMEGIIEHQYGLSHPNTTHVLRQVSQLHLFMLDLMGQYGGLINAELAFNSSNASETFMGSRLPVTDKLLRMGVGNYSKIIESIEGQDGTTPLEHVEAIARLGDWHLILGQRQTAVKVYQQAYGVISETENPGPEIAGYFDQPRLVSFAEIKEKSEDNLSADEASEGVSNEETTEQPDSIQVLMNIQSSGRPYGIKVLDPPAYMTEKLISNTEKNIRSLAFRPRLANGKAVATEGFILNYPIRNPDVKS